MIVKIAGHNPITVSYFEPYTQANTLQDVQIECVADNSGSLGGRCLHVPAPNNTKIYTFWFDVDNGNTVPIFAGSGNTTVVEVDISSDDTDTVVATALQAKINAQTEFGAGSVSSAKVQIVANAGIFGKAILPMDNKIFPTGFSFPEEYGSSDPLVTSIGAENFGGLASGFYKIEGHMNNGNVVQQGSDFLPVPFARIFVSMIVPEIQITQIWE